MNSGKLNFWIEGKDEKEKERAMLAGMSRQREEA
jgi:hypothetical protein